MHDAFLLLSYGAPEIRSDVMPFLKNLFGDQEIPPQTLEKAARQYDELAMRTGQFSPLPQQCRHLLGEILRCGNGPPQPLYWGNLLWHPLLRDTLEEMRDDGIKKAVAFLTSPFDSQVSRDRYLDEIQRIRAEIGPDAPEIDVLPVFGINPLYHRAVADRILESAAFLALEYDTAFLQTRIMFTAHSLPLSDAKSELYRSQILGAISGVVALLQSTPPGSPLLPPLDWELAFQSQGRSSMQWLQPDLAERIVQIAEERKTTGMPRTLLIVPIGFLLENKETAYDLDIGVLELCEEHQIPVVRAAAAGASPSVIQMIYRSVNKEWNPSEPK